MSDEVSICRLRDGFALLFWQIRQGLKYVCFASDMFDCCHAAVLKFGKNCDHFFSYPVINIMADVNIKFLKNYFN